MCMTRVDLFVLTKGKRHKAFCLPEAAIFIQSVLDQTSLGWETPCNLKKTKDSNGIQWYPGTKKWESEMVLHHTYPWFIKKRTLLIILG